MLFIGPEAEKRFGRRHFMGLTAVFTAPPQFTVSRAAGDRARRPLAADREVEGPRLLLLAGPELAGHLRRLDAAAVLRRARRPRRPGPLGAGGRRGPLVRADPRHA